MMKRFFIFTFCILTIIGMVIPISSHSGDLDANGGHYDSSSGEYHYHHGYPAHQHTDGECPYNFHNNVDGDTDVDSGKDDDEILGGNYDFDDNSNIGDNYGGNGGGNAGNNFEFDFEGLYSSIGSSCQNIENIFITIWVIFIVGFVGALIVWGIVILIASAFRRDKVSKNKETTNKKEPSEKEDHIQNKYIPTQSYVKREKITPRVVSKSQPYSGTQRIMSTSKTVPVIKTDSVEISEDVKSIVENNPYVLGINYNYFDRPVLMMYIKAFSTTRLKRAVTQKFFFKEIEINSDEKPIKAETDIYSGSGNIYRTSLTGCSCPDHSSNRDMACKHMMALALKVNAITVDVEEVLNR